MNKRPNTRAVETAHVFAHAAHMLEKNIDRCTAVLCQRMGATDAESARVTAAMAAIVLVYIAEDFLGEALSKKDKR